MAVGLQSGRDSLYGAYYEPIVWVLIRMNAQSRDPQLVVVYVVAGVAALLITPGITVRQPERPLRPRAPRLEP